MTRKAKAATAELNWRRVKPSNRGSKLEKQKNFTVRLCRKKPWTPGFAGDKKAKRDLKKIDPNNLSIIAPRWMLRKEQAGLAKDERRLRLKNLEEKRAEGSPSTDASR